MTADASLPLDDETYAGLQKSAREHLWMHFTRMSSYDNADVPIIVRGEGAYVYDAKGRRYLDALAGLFVSQLGPRPHGARRGRCQAGQGAGVLPAVVLRAPQRHRARRAGRELRPRRPQPGVLHQRRRRGGGDRVEARQELLQAHRQADEAQGDQPLDRLPRHHPGRPVDHRPAGAQGSLRAAGALDLPGAEHELLPRPGARRRPRGLRPLGRRPDRGRDRERGPRDRRRGVPRAGAERRRLLPAPARLLPAGPRDLRRVRRAAGQRRGDLRVRAARPHVRRGALRLPARHDHLRQGHHVRLRTARRDDRQRPADRAVPARRRVVHARLHVRRPPGLHGGRARQPRHLRARGHQPPRAREPGRVPRPRWRS